VYYDHSSDPKRYLPQAHFLEVLEKYDKAPVRNDDFEALNEEDQVEKQFDANLQEITTSYENNLPPFSFLFSGPRKLLKRNFYFGKFSIISKSLAFKKI